MSGAFDPGAAAAPGSGIFGLPFTTDEAKVVVVPVPWAATTSYGGGAERGPEAVLRASKQVDLFDLETGRPYEAKIAMLPIPDRIRAMHDEARPLARAIIDRGGAPEDNPALMKVNALSDAVNAHVYDVCRTEGGRGKLIALLGGDHSAPYGAIRAAAEVHRSVGILHVDAHADLRDAYEGFAHSHASIMHNVLQGIPGVEKNRPGGRARFLGG